MDIETRPPAPYGDGVKTVGEFLIECAWIAYALLFLTAGLLVGFGLVSGVVGAVFGVSL